MKKNFKKLGAALMMTAVTTFTMTSCGGGDSLTDELNDLTAELEKTADQLEADLQEDVVAELPSDVFQSEDGKFQINFGGTPNITTESVPTDVGNIEMTTFMYEKSATEIYAVFYGDYPSSILDVSEPEELLKNGKQGVVNSIGIVQFDVEEELNKDGNAGLHFRGTNGSFYVEYEMYMVGNRLYQVGILRDGSYPTQENIENFFGSFELVN